MPLLSLKTSVDISDEKAAALTDKITNVITDITGKSKSHVMITMGQVKTAMAGEIVPCVFAEFRGIGKMSREVNTELTEALCGLFEDELSIPGDSVYLNFIDINAQNWGWNGSTFG